MKPLILSFFLIILGISLFTNEEDVEVKPSSPTHERLNMLEINSVMQIPDSVVYFLDKSVMAWS